MSRGDVLLRTVARLLLGPAAMVAAAEIAKGYAEVGDGFGAGVIVALAVALFYITAGAAAAERALPMLRYAPAVALGGLSLALASGFFPLVLGEPPFTHRPEPGRPVTTVGTVELFTPLAFDVGIFLLVVGVLTMLLHQLSPAQRPGSEADPDGGSQHSGGSW